MTLRNIKKLFCAFALLFCISICRLTGQTNVPGGSLTGSLTLAGSPYSIQGHVIIPAGSTLTIQPGVIVQFDGHYKLNIQGVLIAQGTVSDTIKFLASPGNISGWWGLRFDMTPPGQDSSKISYCCIQGGLANGTLEDNYGGGIYIKRFSKVRVSHCLIQGNNAGKGGGIYCGSASPLIRGNSIVNNICKAGQNMGAGICCDSSSALILNNFISWNFAGIFTSSGQGGGIYCSSSSALISGNTISSNTTVIGGGIFATFSSLDIINNQITDNYCEAYSGGIHCRSTTPLSVISGNVISRNNAAGSYFFTPTGGGIGFEDFAMGTVTGNTITVNSCGSTGGGIYVFNSSPDISWNNISENRATVGGGIWEFSTGGTIFNNFITNNYALEGGGMSCNSTQTLRILNNCIANNTAISKGGGLICSNNSSPIIANCTIVNNLSCTMPSYTTSLYGGAGIFCTAACSPSLSNCIFYGNLSLGNYGNQVYLDDNLSDPDFLHCDIQGGYIGFYTNGNAYTGAYVNNINILPGFISPTASAGTVTGAPAANWKLNASSPCINTGRPDTTNLNLPPVDLGNVTRIIGGTIDIGCYEFNTCPSVSVNTQVQQQGIILIAGNSTAQYQWLDCNNNFQVVPGATSQTFVPAINGNYAVRVIQGGCPGTSACFLVNTVSLFERAADESLTIYPNPSGGYITIANLPPGENKLFVYSSLGTLLHEEIIENDGKIAMPAAGIYFIKIKTSKSDLTSKIIVER